MKILPQVFYQDPSMHKILVDGNSCIIHTTMQEPVWHKEGYVSTHAITLVLKGLLRVENEDGLFAEVPANKMIFLPKGLYSVSDILPSNGHFEAVVFFFEAELVQELLHAYPLVATKEKCISSLVMDLAPPLEVFTESLLKLYGNEKKARPLTRLKLLEFLHLLAEAQADKDCFLNALSTLNNKPRKSLKQFMLANFHKPLNIEDYAYLTGRSLSTFRRDFKSQFGGISPKQWLIDRRLEKAHELLLQYDRNVSEVVQEIGYENIPHFTKAFHKRYGLPPKQYLVKNRQSVLV